MNGEIDMGCAEIRAGTMGFLTWGTALVGGEKKTASQVRMLHCIGGSNTKGET